MMPGGSRRRAVTLIRWGLVVGARDPEGTRLQCASLPGHRPDPIALSMTCRERGSRVSDNIRRCSRGACWILALILFVLGSAATVGSWASVITLQRGVATWIALTIVLLVLIGRWVGPPAQTREQVKEVKDALDVVAERLETAITKMDAVSFVDARSGAEQDKRNGSAAPVRQLPTSKWPPVGTRKDDHS